ncbi:DUF6630 family protein [Pedobacter borealis]|uniref:DUF6630 family protein n=1 Tax=Pedobacter borealis TaxID=475254 RepID=UPI0004937C29|nr:hypothetical protein [Pedobacter borealis]
MDTKFSQLLMTPEEQNAMVQESFASHQELLTYLLDHCILLQVDWKGEEEEQQIGRFLQDRAAILLPGTSIDIETPYTKLREAVSEGNIDVGDSVPLLLKNFQSQQKKTDLTVVLLDIGNDSYYIGLIKQSDTAKLKKQAGLGWRFTAFGSLTGEVLYTVNCDCGSMNVWQVKRGEKLTDDVCQDCGKQIFDEEGHSSFQVVKDYI